MLVLLEKRILLVPLIDFACIGKVKQTKFLLGLLFAWFAEVMEANFCLDH